MAEFCKDCFVNYLLGNKDRKAYENGKLKIKMSKEKDLCEGCGKMKPVVVTVEKKHLL